MTDRFFPEDFDAVASPNVVSMADALYVIHATIFEPALGSDIGLPPHVWILVQRPPGDPPKALLRSTPSDANGICVILAQQSFFPGDYSLVFAPLPKDIRSGYEKNLEAWVDLGQANNWATPPAAAGIERRRLLRVPAWSTERKASRGGFKVTPTGASTFATTGTLDASEIAPFGTPQAPWEIPLDFNWVRAKVKYSFCDWQGNKKDVVPPGLLVEALRDSFGGRLGAGTAVSPTDGTVYMLLEGDKTVWSSTQIKFRLPANSFVNLSSPAANPDTRLSNTSPPANRDQKNLLPAVWHSRSMRASFGTGATPSAGGAKTWDSLRADVAKDANGRDVTLFFHLDDVVLCDEGGLPIALPKDRFPPTLFDHYLQIIKPNSAVPYQTNVNFVGRVLPAETACPMGSAPPTGRTAFGTATRLVHLEGAFHDLTDDRVGGVAGTGPCVGARAAKLDRHASATISDGFLIKNVVTLHVIDVAGVKDPATGIQLQHLLLHMSVGLKPSSDFPSAQVATVKKLLLQASDRWSPGHPGSTTGPQNKRYALVPQDSAKRNNRITRIRAFFAEAKSPILNLNLKKNTGSARDFESPGIPFLLNQSIDYFDTTVTRDASPDPQTDTGDSQTVNRFTLAHEIGHALGLPDEYTESLDPSEAVDPSVAMVDPRLPAFSQPDEGASDWRPFYSDIRALMRRNWLPRMRHVWHFNKAVNENGAFSNVPDRPYALIHETFSGGLTFKVPPDDKNSPYKFIFKDESIPGGHGECALFPLGDDEGSVEGLFGATPLAAAARMQAVLIVRTRLRFIVDSTLTPAARWQILQDFHEKIYTTSYAPRIRFVLQGGAPFSRIAVLLQPRYAFGTTFNPLASSDLTFDIQTTSARPRPNPFLQSNPGTTLFFLAPQFVFEPAMRLVLGVSPSLPGGKAVNLTTLAPPDMGPLARLVESKLGEKAGSRSVGVF